MLALKNALVSLSNKNNILNFAKKLIKKKVNLYSSGGTYAFLKKSLKVKELKDLAPFPEILDGRVKTIQPQIHGGILFKRDNPEHIKTLKEKKIIPLDLVIVNLYPFGEKVKENKMHEEIIENIDIGGVTLIRAAAKNYQWVTVICDYNDYDICYKEIQKEGNVSLATRKKLALKAFEHTLAYEQEIAAYLRREFEDQKTLNLSLKNYQSLRYGENPHQKAELYFNQDDRHLSLAQSVLLQGKAMSYNNYLDMESGIQILEEFEKESLAVIIKHQNSCGLSVGLPLLKSLEMAWEGDPISAFGSVIVINGKVTKKIADFFKGKFVEIIIALNFDNGAIDIFKTKKNLRLIKLFQNYSNREKVHYRFVRGGILKQDKNQEIYKEFKTVSRVTTKKNTIPLYHFCLKVIKYLKSNAIVIGYEFKKNGFMVVGMGCGQPNRLESVKIALAKASDNLKRLYPKTYQQELGKCVLASDAFFPFRDNIEFINEAGVKKIIQPGGSIRDAEVIAACDEYGINLVFTQMRHFLH